MVFLKDFYTVQRFGTCISLECFLLLLLLFFLIKVTRKGLIFSLIIKILMKYQNFSFH